MSSVARADATYGSYRQNGNSYYNTEDTGTKVTGWQYLKSVNKTFYYGRDGKMVHGVQHINGHWYYFDDTDGHMITGWKHLSSPSREVYYQADGTMAYGQQYINGFYFYFDDRTGGELFNTWKTISSQNKTVYYDGDGHMVYGSQKIDGKWYYFDPHTGAKQSILGSKHVLHVRTANFSYFKSGSDGYTPEAMFDYLVDETGQPIFCTQFSKSSPDHDTYTAYGMADPRIAYLVNAYSTGNSELHGLSDYQKYYVIQYAIHMYDQGSWLNNFKSEYSGVAFKDPDHLESRIRALKSQADKQKSFRSPTFDNKISLSNTRLTFDYHSNTNEYSSTGAKISTSGASNPSLRATLEGATPNSYITNQNGTKVATSTSSGSVYAGETLYIHVPGSDVGTSISPKIVVSGQLYNADQTAYAYSTPASSRQNIVRYEKIGYTDGLSTSATATLNYKEAIPNPVKTVTSSSGTNLDGKTVTPGSELNYTISQKLSKLGSDAYGYYRSINFKDTLDTKHLTYESAKLIDSDGNTYDLNANGKFNYDSSTGEVTYNLYAKSLLSQPSLYDGRSLSLVLTTKVNHWDSSSQTDQFGDVISDQAQTYVNGSWRNSNIVKTRITPPGTPIGATRKLTVHYQDYDTHATLAPSKVLAYNNVSAGNVIDVSVYRPSQLKTANASRYSLYKYGWSYDSTSGESSQISSSDYSSLYTNGLQYTMKRSSADNQVVTIYYRQAPVNVKVVQRLQTGTNTYTTLTTKDYNRVQPQTSLDLSSYDKYSDKSGFAYKLVSKSITKYTIGEADNQTVYFDFKRVVKDITVQYKDVETGETLAPDAHVANTTVGDTAKIPIVAYSNLTDKKYDYTLNGYAYSGTTTSGASDTFSNYSLSDATISDLLANGYKYTARADTNQKIIVYYKQKRVHVIVNQRAKITNSDGSTSYQTLKSNDLGSDIKVGTKFDLKSYRTYPASDDYYYVLEPNQPTSYTADKTQPEQVVNIDFKRYDNLHVTLDSTGYRAYTGSFSSSNTLPKIEGNYTLKFKAVGKSKGFTQSTADWAKYLETNLPTAWFQVEDGYKSSSYDFTNSSKLIESSKINWTDTSKIKYVSASSVGSDGYVTLKFQRDVTLPAKLASEYGSNSIYTTYTRMVLDSDKSSNKTSATNDKFFDFGSPIKVEGYTQASHVFTLSDLYKSGTVKLSNDQNRNLASTPNVSYVTKRHGTSDGSSLYGNLSVTNVAFVNYTATGSSTNGLADTTAKAGTDTTTYQNLPIAFRLKAGYGFGLNVSKTGTISGYNNYTKDNSKILFGFDNTLLRDIKNESSYFSKAGSGPFTWDKTSVVSANDTTDNLSGSGSISFMNPTKTSRLSSPLTYGSSFSKTGSSSDYDGAYTYKSTQSAEANSAASKIGSGAISYDTADASSSSYRSQKDHKFYVPVDLNEGTYYMYVASGYQTDFGSGNTHIVTTTGEDATANSTQHTANNMLDVNNNKLKIAVPVVVYANRYLAYGSTSESLWSQINNTLKNWSYHNNSFDEFSIQYSK